MEALLYFGKVNLYWIMFYTCYWLVFRNHTFFRWNRAYLVGSLSLAFLIPFLSFPDRVPVMPVAVHAVAVFPVYISSPASEPYFSHWTQFIWAIQIIGALIMLSKLAESLRDLIRLLNQGDSIEFENYTLVLLPHNEIGSFSFFKWLVINRNDYEANFEPILNHESVHIRQYHSFDVVFIELLKILFWFNPVLWFYKKSIQEVHEFLADQEAENRDHYARFLVNYALSAPIASLTNHFFNSSLLKSRIRMIYKNRNSQWTLGRYLVVIPAIAIMLMLTAARERLLNALDRNDYKIITKKNISIEGIVRDENGQAIKSATVIVKGTDKGTSTDVNGKFKFDDVATGSTLIISHINYESFSLDVNGVKSLDFITLRKKDNTLAEVLVESKATIDSVTFSSDPAIKFKEVEKQPQFPGGNEELSRFLSSNIMYPSEALRDNVQGQVMVSFTVNEKGYIRNPKVFKGIGSGLDEEALRLVLKMPRWEPGIQGGEAVAVQYNLPITFQLQKDQDKTQGQIFNNYQVPDNNAVNQTSNFKKPIDLSVSDNKSSNIQLRWGDQKANIDNQPLYILDGKIDSGGDLLKKMNPDSIQSISVLKGESAMSAYGFKGRNGVVLIETKKK